jgi:hypothetical protein
MQSIKNFSLAAFSNSQATAQGNNNPANVNQASTLILPTTDNNTYGPNSRLYELEDQLID